MKNKLVILLLLSCTLTGCANTTPKLAEEVIEESIEETENNYDTIINLNTIQTLVNAVTNKGVIPSSFNSILAQNPSLKSIITSGVKIESYKDLFEYFGDTTLTVLTHGIDDKSLYENDSQCAVSYEIQIGDDAIYIFTFKNYYADKWNLISVINKRNVAEVLDKDITMAINNMYSVNTVDYEQCYTDMLADFANTVEQDCGRYIGDLGDMYSVYVDILKDNNPLCFVKFDGDVDRYFVLNSINGVGQYEPLYYGDVIAECNIYVSIEDKNKFVFEFKTEELESYTLFSVYRGGFSKDSVITKNSENEYTSSNIIGGEATQEDYEQAKTDFLNGMMLLEFTN